MGGTGVQLADARTKHAPDQMVHVVHHRQMSHLSVTHPAEGLMRRLVDASRMRIPVPFRSRPRWSRRIPTGIAPGIGHGHAWVFMKSHWQQGGYPKLAASAPNPAHQPTPSRATRPDVPSTSHLATDLQAVQPEARAIPIIETPPERTWIWSDLDLADRSILLVWNRPFGASRR